MSKKISLIWKVSQQDLQLIVDSSNTITEILGKLGYKSSSGNRITFDRAVKTFSIDLTKFNDNFKAYKKKTYPGFKKSTITVDDALCENSNCSRRLVKTLILRHDLLAYKCRDCGLSDVWNGKKITLQLEHINGVNNDNRIENLCFLCPNCHSQTSTWGGRNIK